MREPLDPVRARRPWRVLALTAASGGVLLACAPVGTGTGGPPPAVAPPSARRAAGRAQGPIPDGACAPLVVARPEGTTPVAAPLPPDPVHGDTTGRQLADRAICAALSGQ